jgi:hypothetical protein
MRVGVVTTCIAGVLTASASVREECISPHWFGGSSEYPMPPQGVAYAFELWPAPSPEVDAEVVSSWDNGAYGTVVMRYDAGETATALSLTTGYYVYKVTIDQEWTRPVAPPTVVASELPPEAGRAPATTS